MLFTARFFSFSGFDRKIAEGCGIEYGILQKQKNTKVDSFGGGLENGIKKVQKHERKPVGAFSFRRLMLHSPIIFLNIASHRTLSCIASGNDNVSVKVYWLLGSL